MKVVNWLKRLGNKRQIWHTLIFSAACGVVAGVFVRFAGHDWITDGLFYDLALWTRTGFGHSFKPDLHSTVAVVVIDDSTLDAPELSVEPLALMAPQWAKVINALFAAGAKQVGFDIIFQYVSGRFKPGQDTAFMEALEQHQVHIVLGQTSNVKVADPYYYASGGADDPSTIGLLNIVPDVDQVIRHMHLEFADNEGKPYGTLVGNLVRRVSPKITNDPVMLAPSGPLEVIIPTASMIDVLRCANTTEGRKQLSSFFSQRIVMVGMALPEQDRKTSPDRFFPLPGSASTPETGVTCKLSQANPSLPGSRTVPGVFLHAVALDEKLRGNYAQHVDPWIAILIAVVAVFLISVIGLELALYYSFLSAILLMSSVLIISVMLLRHFFWLEPSATLVSIAAGLAASYTMRYILVERTSNLIKKALSKYLAPSISEALSSGELKAELGGKERVVTIMFADLSGFTELSTKMTPAGLFEITNRYLGYVVEAIRKHNGHVDKFIGDAVMAIWGAPVNDDNHEQHAVQAAIEAYNKVKDEADKDQAKGNQTFKLKIGIATGKAIVGNVGTEHRLNYTAMGETVNTAARMEAAAGKKGCGIALSANTASRVKDHYSLYEAGEINLKGIGSVIIQSPVEPSQWIKVEASEGIK